MTAISGPTSLAALVEQSTVTTGVLVALIEEAVIAGSATARREKVNSRDHLIVVPVTAPEPTVVLIPARAAEPAEIPRAASQLIKAAHASGWTTAATYARARAESSTESLAVRLQGPSALRAVAVWTDGKAPKAWFTLDGRQWFAVGAVQLRMAIK